MARVSREQAALNRKKVVAAASVLFRRDGFDGACIDDVMAKSGLTRGAFYGQFGSKEELAAEACDHAFEAAAKAWKAAAGIGDDASLSKIVEFYLKPDVAGQDCPLATLAGDAGHAPTKGPFRRAFTRGMKRLVTVFAGPTHDDEEALAVLAAMVGAKILRRASDNKSLANAVDVAVRKLASDRL